MLKIPAGLRIAVVCAIYLPYHSLAEPSGGTHQMAETNLARSFAQQTCHLYPTGRYAYRSLQPEPPMVGVSEDGTAKFSYANRGRSIQLSSLEQYASLAQIPLLAQKGEVRVLVANGDYVILRGNSLQWVPKNSIDSPAASAPRAKQIVLPNQLGKPKFIQVSSDHKTATYVQSYSKTDDARTVSVDLATGNIEYIAKPKSPTLQDGRPHQIYDLKLLDQKNELLSLHDNGILSIWNTTTKQEKNIQLFQKTAAAQISPDGKEVYSLNEDKELQIWSSEGKVRKTIPIKEYIREKLPKTPGVILRLSSDGNKIGIKSGQYLVLVDLKSGQIESLHDKSLTEAHQIEFSSDGNYLKTDTADPYEIASHHQNERSSRLFSLQQNPPQEVTLPEKFKTFVFAKSRLGSGPKVIGLSQGRGPYIIESLSTVCIADKRHSIQPSEKHLASDGRVQTLKSLLEDPLLCGPASNTQTRKNRLEALRKNEKWDHRDAYQMLLLLQTPGLLDPEKDLPFIITVLGSPLVQADAPLIVGLLANIATASSMLYESLIEKFPHLQELKKEADFKDAASHCVSQEDFEKLKNQGTGYLNQRLALFLNHDQSTSNPAYDQDWRFLRPFTALLSMIPQVDKVRYIENVGDTLFEAANQDPRLGIIPDGVKLTFVTEIINPLFGEKSNARTDAVYDAKSYPPKLIILGNGELNTERPAESKDHRQLGFHIKEIPLTDEGRQETVRWTHNGKRYEATVNKQVSVPTAEEGRVNSFLTHPDACKFVHTTSHWYQDGVLATRLRENPERRSRVIVTRGGADLLQQCEELKSRLGSKSCESIEIAGHSSMGCGATGLFGVVSSMGQSGALATIPPEPKLFKEVVKCLKDVLREGKPLVVTSCFSNMYEPMQHLSTVLARPVIAAGGLCSSLGWGATSSRGWSEMSPDQPPPVQIKQLP